MMSKEYLTWIYSVVFINSIALNLLGWPLFQCVAEYLHSLHLPFEFCHWDLPLVCWEMVQHPRYMLILWKLDILFCFLLLVLDLELLAKILLFSLGIYYYGLNQEILYCFYIFFPVFNQFWSFSLLILETFRNLNLLEPYLFDLLSILRIMNICYRHLILYLCCSYYLFNLITNCILFRPY